MRNLTLPYFLLEGIFIYLFVSKFGFLNFILEVLLSGLLGVMLIFKFGFMNFKNQIRVLTPKDIFGGLGTIFGAFLLILPGIFCDIAGVLILVISIFINKKLDNSNNTYNNTQDFTQENTQNNTYTNRQNDDNIIDVEIIEEEKIR